MEVFIIAAITADGFIGRNAEHLANWTSPEDKKFFVSKTKEAGVVVMGRKTFETIGKPLKDRLNIVYTKSKLDVEGVEATSKDPHELVEDLRERGFKKLAVCGGASIYTLFMNSGLVNKVYLTVEPVFFGSGVKLFNDELSAFLRLQKVSRLNKNTILLEYLVDNN